VGGDTTFLILATCNKSLENGAARRHQQLRATTDGGRCSERSKVEPKSVLFVFIF
jgi:hypothetical protein